MLGKLFRRLTSDRGSDATALFAGITAAARQPHFYVDGGIADDIDGRFALLATIAALVIVRLEALGDDGDHMAAALTGRFAEVMDSEHRELGVGEPTLGKTVLKLVGALGRRVDVLRSAGGSDESWASAIRQCLPLQDASDAQLRHCAKHLGALRASLADRGIVQLADGEIE